MSSYRNKISLANSSIDSSITENSDNESPVIRIIDKREKNDDSISEMFKKMSLKDRNSILLSNNENEKEIPNSVFMTSSPISKNSIPKKPVFKIHSQSPNLIFDKENQNPRTSIANKDDNENFGNTNEGFKLTSETSFNNRSQIKKTLLDRINENESYKTDTNLTKSHVEIKKRNLVRAETVKCCRKPLLPTGTIENLKIKSTGKTSNKSLTRSNSSYRSNSSLNATSKVTIPKPFSFEGKDKALLANRIKLVEDDILEKKRIASSFRANPMLVTSPMLPEKKVAKTTNPVGFKFESEQRLNYYQEKSSLKSFLETSSTSSISINKTTDLSYLSKSPFKPKRSDKSLTNPEDPSLVLKSRLEHRKEFDEVMRQKELQLQQEAEQREKERIEKEQLEYLQIRSKTVVKAQPIRLYKPIEIVHVKKVTNASSPKLSDRLKK